MAREHLRINWNTVFYDWDDHAVKGFSAEFRSLPSPVIMRTAWYLKYISVHEGVDASMKPKSKITLQLCREYYGEKLQIKGILSHSDTTYYLDCVMESDGKHVTIFEKCRLSLPKNRKTLTCDAWITKLTKSEETSGQTVSTFSKLLRDLHTLYGKQDYSDMVVICKGVEIRVHKCVLSARSPVFAHMFVQAASESNNNRVVITDIDPDILEELLKFLYFGEINPSIYSRAHDLYYAAERYFVSDLKDICRDLIISSLSSTTAVETLLLADTYKDEEMMQKAVTFIASSFQDVKSTDAWNILRKNSLLATHVISLIAEKSHSQKSDSL